MLCYFVIINFYKNYFIIIIFYENYFYFIMFRDVPACSEMFRVPGFTDAHFKIESESPRNHELPSEKQMLPLK